MGYDFSNMSREEAKEFAHTLVTSCIMMALVGTLCMTFCFGGCCLLAINKVKKN